MRGNLTSRMMTTKVVNTNLMINDVTKYTNLIMTIYMTSRDKDDNALCPSLHAERPSVHVSLLHISFCDCMYMYVYVS